MGGVGGSSWVAGTASGGGSARIRLDEGAGKGASPCAGCFVGLACNRRRFRPANRCPTPRTSFARPPRRPDNFGGGCTSSDIGKWTVFLQVDRPRRQTTNRLRNSFPLAHHRWGPQRYVGRSPHPNAGHFGHSPLCSNHSLFSLQESRTIWVSDHHVLLHLGRRWQPLSPHTRGHNHHHSS